jgi:CHAT domain
MKRVTLTLMQGSFEKGFPSLLRIWDDCHKDKGPSQIPGKLPPALEVLTTFNEWEVPYRELMQSRLMPNVDLPSNVSIPKLARIFENRFRAWLKSGDEEWQKIREYLLQNLDANEEILVIIETQDPDLRKLPWHLWDLFSDTYLKAEVVISAADYEPLLAQAKRSKPRLLAVLGNSQGIDVEKDRKILKKFLDVDIKFLVEPELSDLMDLLWQQSWDIFYFAGHSYSEVDGNSGFLWIQDSAVPMERLKPGLEQAMKKGMRIAIFNSCDGLGLAKELANLHIPQVVVMREPVPDLVAQEFLKFFLKFFAAGQPLYLAVRKARSRLKVIS